ncbi:MAG: glycosyltransferase family 4 protein [Cyanobacteria bacterium SZAS LIN-3]|nr:glycosyltransferase family 4 protein [Cyanobacteria bacterium SZAS LIN-3]MBS2007295.1 glycosyltransferase family 4 protein [Cyanobacteria bacterium SZAS TMP-1]
MDSKTKILLITLEPIAKKMAGPAIRALELGKILARDYATVVFSPVEGGEPPEGEMPPNLRLVRGGGSRILKELAENAETIFIQSNVLKPFPFLSQMGKYLILDLYDPYLFSILVQYKNDRTQASASYRMMHKVLEAHMLACDLAVCASERQRDYWIGRFCAQGRVTPEMYEFDPSLRKLIDVVPYGLPQEEPQKHGDGAGLRAIPGIGAEDPVLIWGGGIWDWFDPLSVIEGVKACIGEIPDLRLVFMGTKSPNPKVEVMDMTKRARALAQESGLLDKNIFFLDGWVPYEQRVNYLLEATAAVSAHFDLPETRFSFRTRILDYFWCGLPILTTTGDGLAELIQQNGAGLVLPYQDAGAWAEAIKKVVKDGQSREAMRQGSKKIAKMYHWQDNAEPIRRFLQAPYHLPQYTPVTMPNLAERARAVYRRGGGQLIIKRSVELINDILK